jgi:hypothetical protein
MKTVLILVISATVLILAIGYYTCDHPFPGFKPVVTKVSIQSPHHDDVLYIKRKAWGLLGNSQVIVVTNSPDEQFEPDADREYVFRGLSGFFYGFEGDTLTVYVRAASGVPKDLRTEIHIKQVVLNNPDMMDMHDTYKERGLQELAW